ncbi:MAG TPA: transposase [Methylocella sp.]|nr:transposase [Methylocella sp.]
MARRRIGLTAVRFGAAPTRQTSLDKLGAAIALPFADFVVAALYSAAKGANAWHPLAMFKAPLLATWRDLSDVALSEALTESYRALKLVSSNKTAPTAPRSRTE